MSEQPFDQIDLRARKAVVLAQAIGRDDGAACMGPEHLWAALLGQGLVDERPSNAVRALEAVGVDLGTAWLISESLRGRRRIQPLTEKATLALWARGIDLDAIAPIPVSERGEDEEVAQHRSRWRRPKPAPERPEDPPGYLPFAVTAKRSIGYMYREGLRLNDASLGTEHLPLGLVRWGDERVVRGLEPFGVGLDKLRAAVESMDREPDS